MNVEVKAADSAPRLQGSCLCGDVAYEVCGPVGPVSHCHCSQCRKAHGAAFGSYAAVSHRDFGWLQGAELVRSFRSSAQAARTFCSRCGTSLQYLPDGDSSFSLAVATLDDDPHLEIVAEIWSSVRREWADPGQAPEHHRCNLPVRQNRA